MNRRTLLAAAGPVALAAAIPATAALAPEPVPFVHPDAALLDAWDRYVASWRAIDALADAGRLADDDPDRVAAYGRMHAADDALLNVPWRTPAGLAVKLRRMVLATEPTVVVSDAVIYGRPIPAAELVALDAVDRLPMTMLQQADALAAA